MRWPRISLVVLFVGALLFLAGEITLRLCGFRQFPVFVADAGYEYMTAPFQNVRPRGHRFITNELGMRCGPIGVKKTTRVLVIGDSVINGVYSTDQDALATSLVQLELGIQVLNCSAPSWGPDNAAAFLRAHGTLDADLIIAVFSSHDAFDRMTFEPVVGRYSYYPDHRPALAWSMFLDKLFARFGGYPPETPQNVFNEGWSQLRDLSRAQDIPLVILLHPELGELGAGNYDPRGRELLDSLHSWQLPVVEMIDRMDSSMYNDFIHVNDEGQRALANAIASAVAFGTAP